MPCSDDDLDSEAWKMKNGHYDFVTVQMLVEQTQQNSLEDLRKATKQDVLVFSEDPTVCFLPTGSS
jgi:hypothetical protein